MSSKGGHAVTALRFPEFLGKPLHDLCLGDVTEEATARNGNKLARALVMGVRKEGGIVPMEERLVAGDIARYKNVQKSWFAYNPMRLNIGSIAQWQGDEEVLVSPDYVVFRCNPASLLPEYLDHFRSSRQWEAFTNESGDGGVRIRIYYRDIARMRLMLPDVIEQKKIADCLSSIDALIAAEAEKLDALKDHKKGLLQQLFPDPGETTPRLRFPEFQDAGDWRAMTIGDVSSVTTGKRDTQNKDSNGTYPFFVRSQTIERINSFSYDGEAILTSGDGVGVGKNFHYIVGKFDFHQRVYCIYKFRKNVSGHFIFHYFSSNFFDHVSKLSAKNSVDSVRMSMITDMPLQLPTLHEQRKIADCLSSIDALVAAQGSRIDALKAHKQGLMQQLFPMADQVQA